MAALKKKWALEAFDISLNNFNKGTLPFSMHNFSFAAIFDMDGTLIDNTPYHYKSWQALFRKYGKGELSKATYYTEISGVPVFESIKRIFGSEFDEAV